MRFVRTGTNQNKIRTHEAKARAMARPFRRVGSTSVWPNSCGWAGGPGARATEAGHPCCAVRLAWKPPGGQGDACFTSTQTRRASLWDAAAVAWKECVRRGGGGSRGMAGAGQKATAA